MARRIAMGITVLALFPLCAADRPRELRYQEAVELFESKGDIPGAIKLFEDSAKSSDRNLAARSLLYLGICYEKLGRTGAEQAYRRILSEFSDEPAASQARIRLAALNKDPRAMVARKIERAGREFSAIDTDGQRVVYRDKITGEVMLGDLAGRTKRVIYKSKPGEVELWVPSPDFSMIALVFNPKPDRPRTIAVVNIDGTGFRELARNDEEGKREGLGFNRVRRVNWSWDGRLLAVVVPSDDNEVASGRLLLLSIADGKRRKLVDAEAGMLWGGVFSPDKRFVAYEVVNGFNSSPERTFIVPVGGGRPSLIHEEPRGRLSDSGILDWTADGRYLAISSRASGSFALHLFPVEEGRASGAPVSIRTGHFVQGHTTRKGALICELSDEVRYTAHVASLDANGTPGAWQRIELREPPFDMALSAHWSPDSSRILYTSRNLDLGQSASQIVRVYELATARDTEIHRSRNINGCVWGNGPSRIFCRELLFDGPQTVRSSVYSLSLESGGSEALATFPWTAYLSQPNRDASSLYLAILDPGANAGRLVQLNIETKQQTMLMEGATSSGMPPRISADDRWLIQADGFNLRVRPLAGGDWKQLAAINRAASSNKFASEFAPTPDGKWVLYRDVDRSGKHGLFRVPISGGKPERLGDYAGPVAWFGNLEVSPDGRKVVAESVSAEQPTEIWLLQNFVPSR